MSDRKTVFVLGAPDPESMFLFRTLTACGFIVEWATCGGVPVSPRTAYEADVVEIQNRYYNPVFVWVECLPRECSRAKLEGCHGDKLIDHHNPGDKGYGRSEAEAFEASSVGQLADLALVMAASASSEERAKWNALHDALTTPDAVAIGCSDHCLPAALAGRCIDPEGPRIASLTGNEFSGLTRASVDPYRVLRLRAESREDAALAALLNRAPVSAADVLAGIARDRAVLATAPRFALGGQTVFDLTGLPGGTLRYAQEAVSLEGGAYLATNPLRPGMPPTVVIGGATTPACVEAFMAAARRAVIRHREALFTAVWTVAAGEEVVEPDGTRGIIVGSRGLGTAFEVIVRANDRDWWWHAAQLSTVDPEHDAAVAALEAFTKACAASRNGDGVYGDPARGFAGTYAPIECVRAALEEVR